ncbi:hypothetical protein HNY73_015902 [Argiope bruennichi]|uniref:Uncharacterized protein n=1 Tax=Argiope bruennichi TaxID=94029 RepID=A0A8T0EIB7_ARGBR|nr:hypothetical protein HNY73_015902 [Argiope bruennichi]
MSASCADDLPVTRPTSDNPIWFHEFYTQHDRWLQGLHVRERCPYCLGEMSYETLQKECEKLRRIISEMKRMLCSQQTSAEGECLSESGELEKRYVKSMQL